MQSQPDINSSQSELMRFASSKLLKIETAFGLGPNQSTRRTSRFDLNLRLVEVNGIEPMTSCLQSRRSPN